MPAGLGQWRAWENGNLLVLRLHQWCVLWLVNRYVFWRCLLQFHFQLEKNDFMLYIAHFNLKKKSLENLASSGCSCITWKFWLLSILAYVPVISGKKSELGKILFSFPIEKNSWPYLEWEPCTQGTSMSLGHVFSCMIKLFWCLHHTYLPVLGSAKRKKSFPEGLRRPYGLPGQPQAYWRPHLLDYHSGPYFYNFLVVGHTWPCSSDMPGLWLRPWSPLGETKLFSNVSSWLTQWIMSPGMEQS